MTNLPITVDSMLPGFDWDDDNKREYLGWRTCGFTRKEARDRIEITKPTVDRWIKQDSAFAEIEQQNVYELRNQYAKEFIKLDFFRNLKLALRKDAQVLEKANSTDKRSKLTSDEWGYLKSIRGLYTAKEINALDSVFSSFNDSDWDSIMVAVKLSKSNGSEKVKRSKGTDQEISESEEYQESTVIAAWEARGPSSLHSEEEDIIIDGNN